MRKDVYEKVHKFSQHMAAVQALSSYDQHFLQAALKDFERAGLALSSEDGKRLQELLEQDAAVCAEYGANLRQDSTKLYFTPEELNGCGEEFIQQRLDEDGKKCTVTLKYPDIIPIGSNCSVAETRRIVAHARGGPHAYKNNLDLVAQGIQLEKRLPPFLVIRAGRSSFVRNA
jgi:Zn-dependent oligopeptidase